MSTAWYDFATGNVHAPEAYEDAVMLGGAIFTFTNYRAGRVIDNIATATEAADQYGTIRGFNTSEAAA